MKSVLLQARELGCSRSRSALVELAHLCATAADQNKIDVEDAAEIYREYLAGTRMGADTTGSSFRANASKLRQIIKSANPGLLKQVEQVYDKHAHQKSLPLYHVIIEAARRDVAGRSISEPALLQLVRKARK
jgi:hypothetical protein